MFMPQDNKLSCGCITRRVPGKGTEGNKYIWQCGQHRPLSFANARSPLVRLADLLFGDRFSANWQRRIHPSVESENLRIVASMAQQPARTVVPLVPTTPTQADHNNYNTLMNELGLLPASPFDGKDILYLTVLCKTERLTLLNKRRVCVLECKDPDTRKKLLEELDQLINHITSLSDKLNKMG